MGRTVFADEDVQDKLNALAKAKKFHIGLLIGQNGKEKDYLVHLAPTPLLEPEYTEEQEEDKDKKVYAPDCLNKVEDRVIVQHAKQVIRMLPGGLEVIGVYVATPQADFTASSSQAKLRSLLTIIHRSMSRILLGVLDACPIKTILHICTETFKYNCKVLDVSNSLSSVENGEIKFQRGGNKWQQLNFSYNLDLTLWLPVDKDAQSLYKSLLSSLKPWADSITESLILINGTVMNEADLLDPTCEEKTSKRKMRGGVVDLAPKVHTLEILDVCGVFDENAEKRESSGCVRFAGTVAGRAFMHAKATVEEATVAVQCDLIRSLVSRWEMHCDSLVEEQPSSACGPVIHEPPRRVFLEGGGLPVSLCDYLFPGDTAADACQSAKELLGIAVHEDHVDDALETLADASEVLGSAENEVEGGEKYDSYEGLSHTSPPCSLTHVMLAVAVVVVGIGISYISLLGTKAVS
ncbi:protein odr-4 homolog [Oratosquilla oratoria]|uniref:protein odr-4 homolog n=1 Tax=Oratosquilla oratoria TaxID=337810 RepID=UPI003F76B4DA